MTATTLLPLGQAAPDPHSRPQGGEKAEDESEEKEEKDEEMVGTVN